MSEEEISLSELEEASLIDLHEVEEGHSYVLIVNTGFENPNRQDREWCRQLSRKIDAFFDEDVGADCLFIPLKADQDVSLFEVTE